MKIKNIFTALFLVIALVFSNVSTALAMPPVPSSFNGTIKLDGADVPAGTVISARINGVEYASMEAILYAGDSVYFFDVPGEDPDIAGVQGGVPGDTVVFYIGSYVADQTALWQSGTSIELNLTGTSFRTVTFNANGGTGTMTPQVANVSTALTTNTFMREGYTFSGWNTLANGTGTNYADGAIYSFTSNITLYAKWTVNSYTITFNSNGGSAVAAITQPFGSAVSAPTAPTKTWKHLRRLVQRRGSHHGLHLHNHAGCRHHAVCQVDSQQLHHHVQQQWRLGSSRDHPALRLGGQRSDSSDQDWQHLRRLVQRRGSQHGLHLHNHAGCEHHPVCQVDSQQLHHHVQQQWRLGSSCDHPALRLGGQRSDSSDQDRQHLRRLVQRCGSQHGLHFHNHAGSRHHAVCQVDSQ